MRVVGMFTLLVVTHAVVYYLGVRYGARKDPQIVAIKEHSKLLRKARWAALMRKDGLANIYAEAAARCLDRIVPTKELNSGWKE